MTLNTRDKLARTVGRPGVVASFETYAMVEFASASFARSAGALHADAIY